MNPTSHVYFNRGQRLTPELLNRSSDQHFAALSMVAQVLGGKHGIVMGYQQSCRLQLIDEQTLCIGSGAGMTILGELVLVHEPILIRLQNLIEPGLYFVQCRQTSSLENPFQDPEFPQITGFEVKSFKPIVFVSRDQDPEAFEIARIRIGTNDAPFSLAEAGDDPDLTQVIDQRPAAKVHLFAPRVLDFEAHQSTLRSVSVFSAIADRLSEKMSHITGFKSLATYADLLLLEVQSPFISTEKCAYLLLRIQHHLLESLEKLRFDLQTILRDQEWSELLLSVNQLGSREHRGQQFLNLNTISVHLEKGLLQETTHRGLVLKEALAALRKVDLGSHRHHAISGRVYELVETIEAREISLLDKDQLNFFTMMHFHGAYKGEENQQYRAVFIGTGEIELPLPSLDHHRDAVIQLRIFKRRGRCKIHFEVNGHSVAEENLTSADGIQEVMNLFIVVERQWLTRETNHLRIRHFDSDIEIGLIDCRIFNCTEAS